MALMFVTARTGTQSKRQAHVDSLCAALETHLTVMLPVLQPEKVSY